MGPWCTAPHRSADRLPSRSTAVTRYRIHQSRSRPSPITSPHHRPRSFGFGSSFPALSNITSSSSLRTIRALPAYFPFHSPLPKLWFTDPPLLALYSLRPVIPTCIYTSLLHRFPRRAWDPICRANSALPIHPSSINIHHLHILCWPRTCCTRQTRLDFVPRC